MDDIKFKTNMKWSTELEKVETEGESYSAVSIDEAHAETVDEAHAETVDEAHAETVDEAYVETRQSKLEDQINLLQENIEALLKKLIDIDEKLKEQLANGGRLEILQNLKSTATTKKSMLEAYNKVLANIVQNVMPTFYLNIENKNIIDSITVTVSEVFNEINKLVLDTEQIIREVNSHQ